MAPRLFTGFGWVFGRKVDGRLTTAISATAGWHVGLSREQSNFGWSAAIIDAPPYGLVRAASAAACIAFGTCHASPSDTDGFSGLCELG